jgi:hypothetical protein
MSFGTKRVEEVDLKSKKGYLIHKPTMPGLKDAIQESFAKVTRSNLGTTLGMIIFEYARPPTDREKLVWILEENTSHSIYFNCASATIPHLEITITWGKYQNHKTYPQRNYMATVSSKQYGTRQQIIYFDDMLPHG